MSDNNSSVSVSFNGLLTIVFITLKLTGVINWKWLWVLSPLWIGLSVFLIIVFLILFFRK